MHRRPGLSRIEVIVVLLILILLTGLILTAIARVRDAQARAMCQSNLRQWGVTVHNYRDTYNGPLPPLTDQGDDAPTGDCLPSAFATLIPFIEQAPIFYVPKKSPPSDYHAPSSVPFTFYNKLGDIGGTEYGGVANRPLRVFLDPADTTADHLRDVPMKLPNETTGYYATGSYAFNGLLWRGNRGVLSLQSGVAANTVLIAERPQVCRTQTGDVVYNLWGVGFYSPHMPTFATLTPTDPPGLWSTEQVAPVTPLPGDDAADRDAQIRIRVGRVDAEPQPPDFSYPVQLIGKNRTCDPRLPGSPHSQGMQVMMADGSVRVFSFDTAPWVFWAACVPGPDVPEVNPSGGR